MTIGLDRAVMPATKRDDPLPDLTPHQARQLAAVLAQHMMAMRAVTAGTEYGEPTGTEIFIAGTLELICAGEQADPAECECARDDVTLSARTALAG
jgi:hypothetical protein